MASADTNIGPRLLIIAIVVAILTTLTTIIRFLVRYQRRAVGADDYTIAVANALAIGRIVVQIVSVPHGNGRHREFISKTDYEYVNFLTWLTQLFLFPILCLLKTSVCLLVLRIKSTKKLRYSLWTLITLLILTTLLPEIVLLAECSPVSAYWMSESAKCWDPDVRIYSIYLQTSVSVFADVVCTLLPIAVVWNLKLSMKDKVSLCGLMSLGVISTAFACLRASSLGLAVTDLSWTYCWAAIWGDIELGFGILGANLALSRTYYDYFRRGVRGLSTYTRSGTRSDRANTISDPHLNRFTKDRHAPYDGSGGSKNSTKVKTRKDSGALSDEIPLEPTMGIKKEIEFSIEENDDRSLSIPT